MKDFFKSSIFKVILAVVFILLGIILYTASTGNSFIASAVSIITTPIQKISSSISYAANNSVANKNELNQLKEKVSSLEAENQSLRAMVVDYYDVKKENTQFAKYYDLKQKNPSLKFVSASVIGRDPNDNFYGFTANSGTNAGISVNDPVITDNGLIGWVDCVYANSCKIKTILSPESKISAIDKMSGDCGVITGSTLLADSNKTKLTFIQSANNIKPGDIIVTTGLSGIYPKNLLIGTAKELQYDSYDGSICSVIEPFEDIPNVRDVFIVTQFEGKGDIVTDSAKSQIEVSSASSAEEK